MPALRALADRSTGRAARGHGVAYHRYKNAPSTRGTTVPRRPRRATTPAAATGGGRPRASPVCPVSSGARAAAAAAVAPAPRARAVGPERAGIPELARRRPPRGRSDGGIRGAAARSLPCAAPAAGAARFAGGAARFAADGRRSATAGGPRHGRRAGLRRGGGGGRRRLFFVEIQLGRVVRRRKNRIRLPPVLVDRARITR